MNPVKRYTITAALPYANGPIHLGHVAGAYLPADIYARYLRQKKAIVAFISGSDEHGVSITIRARQEQSTPQQVVDKYHSINKKALEDFGISCDIFARTSSPTHYETAADFFTKINQKSIFEVKETEQYYDPMAGQFLPDRYLKGTCPHCTHDGAYGDQCEACGSALNPEELINPISAISGEHPILKPTKHWFLPLNQYEKWLQKWLLKDQKPLKTNVYGQCKGWLDQGLRPRAVTRDLSWGIPLPLPEGKDKVLYVWFDAPIGYISATKEWATEQKIDWRPFWKDPNTKLIHFIGKDNIVFHSIIFPVMLYAHGDFILPKEVVANEFLNLEGRKFSTSKNHAIWLHEYLKDFEGKQDVMRYVLCAIAPENKDSDFTWKDFQAKNNNELVANLGNLVHRTLHLVNKYFDGMVPPYTIPHPIDQPILLELDGSFKEVGNMIELFKFKEALQLCMGYAALGNKYLADQQPWSLVKTDVERAGNVLHITLQLIATVTLLIRPFLPTTSQKMVELLGLTTIGWDDIKVRNLLKVGSKLATPLLLFDKIEDDAIEAQLKKLGI